MQVLTDYNKAYVVGAGVEVFINAEAFATGTYTVAGAPNVPRNVVLTITDADTSIDAFSVTVNGTDIQDKSVSETFVFADGLVQSGTQTFKTITTVVATVHGEGAGDTILLDTGAYVQLTKGTSTLVSVVSTQTSCGPLTVIDDYDVSSNGVASIAADKAGVFEFNITLTRGLRIGTSGTAPYTIIYKQ